MSQAASLDYLRTRAIRIAQRFSPDTSPLETMRAVMQDGAMAGLSADLDGRGFTVGGDADNDVVVLDPQADDIRLHVASRRSAIGALVHLSCDQPGVTGNGSSVDGAGVWERMPCRVDMAGVSMVLDRADRRGGVAMAGLAYVAVIAVAALIFLSFPARVTTHGVSAPTVRATPAQAPADATQLAAMIDAAGIAPYVQITPGSGETLRVTGRVPVGRMAAWRDVRMAWDARSDTPPLVSRVSEMKGLDQVPPIAAVRLGDAPYILLADGRNIQPGDILTDGWTVTEIRPTRFLLSRNGEDIDITF